MSRGNPEEDAYAFLVGIVTDCIAKGRFRPGLTDPNLVAQVVWSGVHGVVSLEIAKCNDDWINWTPDEQRISLMIDILVAGLTKE